MTNFHYMTKVDNCLITLPTLDKTTIIDVLNQVKDPTRLAQLHRMRIDEFDIMVSKKFYELLNS